MPYTPPTPAQRVDAMLSQLAPLDQLTDAVADWRAAEIRHARTNRADDYLDTLTAFDEVLCIIERASRMDFTDQRAILADEAVSECRYDMREGCYLDHNNEPIIERRDTRHPDDNGRGFRVGGAA